MKKSLLLVLVFGALNAFAGAPNLICENETGTVALVKENGAFPIVDLYKDMPAGQWTLPKGLYTRASTPVDTNEDILTVCNEGYYMTLTPSNKAGYNLKLLFVCRVDSAPTMVLEVADVNCWD